MRDASEFRYTVKIEKFDETGRNDHGEQVGNWSQVLSRRAAVKYKSPAQEDEADKTISKVGCEIVVRLDNKTAMITGAHRAILDGRTFDIHAPLLDRVEQEVMLDCEEVTDGR